MGFRDRVRWINTSKEGWIDNAREFKPDIILHSAWAGVGREDRDDMELQKKNIGLAEELIHIARLSNTKTIIGLGSQAEYGYLDSIAKEDMEAKPLTAYGKTKLRVMNMFREFGKERDINWYWLRVFALCGGRQDETWLIPSLISKIKDKETNYINLGSGEERFAYLDVREAAAHIRKVVESPDRGSGIYNISGVGARSIREIVEDIRDELRPDFELRFGMLSQRKTQSLWVEGCMSKFNRDFGY